MNLNVDRKLTILIALWILDKLIMLGMFLFFQGNGLDCRNPRVVHHELMSLQVSDVVVGFPPGLEQAAHQTCEDGQGQFDVGADRDPIEELDVWGVSLDFIIGPSYEESPPTGRSGVDAVPCDTVPLLEFLPEAFGSLEGRTVFP